MQSLYMIAPIFINNMKIFFYILPFLSFGSCGGEGVIIPPKVELPILSMDALSVDEGNKSAPIFLSLRLNKVSENSVTVFLQTVDNTAIEGEDYVGFSSQQIEFEPGDVQANCKLEIVGDEVYEEDERFILKITQIDGATFQNSEVAIEILNDDIQRDINIPNSGYSTPMQYEGMELIWNDEFEGEELNEETWSYEIGNGSGGWGNNELQFYRKENTTLVDGHLVIQAREETFAGFNYTSSRLITKDKFEFTFGRVDIRAALPEGQGIWPALWMLGANISEVSWPQCGEIDIMELIGNLPGTVHGTVHFGESFAARMQNGNTKSLSGGKKYSQEFHVFSIDWKEDRVDFYMDDIHYHTVTKSSLGTGNPYPFNNPFFFIFNVAVGGNWPGSPDNTTELPQHMVVDYIRVFQNN